MIAVIDYGVGNLFSLSSSLKAIGEAAAVTGDAEIIRRADGIILPGVGAFRDAAQRLRDTGLDTVLKREAAAGKPLMGICLGMQLLFDESLEYGRHTGLGLIPGTVRPIRDVIDPSLKVPQMGWNSLRLLRDHPLTASVREGDCVYFVHSYYADTPAGYQAAVTDYSCPLTAIAARDNVCGCQFHPEKSGEVGLRILRSFCALCREKEEIR